MWGRHKLTLETGEIARQASGAVMVSIEDTVVLVTVVGKKSADPAKDFLPLTVDYQERTYAAGKIPGGFFKREGRPSETGPGTPRPAGTFAAGQGRGLMAARDDVLAAVGNGAICTLSLSFNNDGPLGTFFRYIGDTGTYLARYDDLFNGKDEKIDVSNVDVSMNGIELQDREFFAAIKEGREPNASVAQCFQAMKTLDTIEKSLL